MAAALVADGLVEGLLGSVYESALKTRYARDRGLLPDSRQQW